MLIIVCGLPGSGKTTLARALSRRLKAVLLSSDAIRKGLFPKPSYSDEEKRAVYDEMALRAGRELASGKDVIADATFYKAWQREAFLSLAAEKGARSAMILCTLEEEHARVRLGRRRPGGMSDADFGTYMKLKAEFEPIREGHLVIDTHTPLRERVEKTLSYLKG